MTQEEILTMQPGRELDIEVAQKIMGHIIADDETLGYVERFIDPDDGSSLWSSVTPYSADISAAWSVIDRMIDMGYEDTTHWANFGDGRYTKAEAICKAALLAVLERSAIKEASDKLLRQALGDEWGM